MEWIMRDKPVALSTKFLIIAILFEKGWNDKEFNILPELLLIITINININITIKYYSPPGRIPGEVGHCFWCITFYFRRVVIRS